MTLGYCAEKAMATHSSTLACKIPWTEEPGGLQSMGSWLSNFTFAFYFPALEKEMATHSSVLAWRIPGMGEPGGLLSMGSHRVGHDWSDLAAAAGYCELWWVVFPEQLLEVGGADLSLGLGCEGGQDMRGMWGGREEPGKRLSRACWAGDDTDAISQSFRGSPQRRGNKKHSPLSTVCQKCISWHFQPFRVEPIRSFVFACTCFQSLWCCVMQCKQGPKRTWRRGLGGEGIWRIFGT